MQYINIPSEIAQRAEGFVGRTWVSDQVLEWLDRGTERYFLLTGKPGSGKTALAAWLAGAGPAPQNAESRDRLARVRSTWSAGHFCVGRTQGETINPSRFASALAQQLSDRFSSYATAAVSAIDPEYNIHQDVKQNWGEVIGIKTNTLIINGRHPEEVYDLAIRRPLEFFLSSQPSLRICILVDALDEALLYDDEDNIATLLAGSTNLPKRVRFLLTCRSNERRVIDKFEDVRQLDISSSTYAENNDDDVQSYVLKRLSDPVQIPIIPAGASVDALAGQLVAAADSNFLYLRFLLDEVQAGQRSLGDLAGLPRGLYALYRGYLDRVIPDVDSRNFAETWLNVYEPLLGSLSVAVPVAPNRLLPRWLDWDKGQVQARLGTVTQVIECTQEYEGGCSLFHRSMAEFLSSAFYPENNALRLNQYYAEPLRQHGRIVRYYLKAIRDTWQGDWGKCDNYGLHQLVNHLRVRLALAEEDDRAPLAAELYRVVLDEGFRTAQQKRLANVSAPLPDLRSALETALARDDLVHALRCVAAYRQTVRSKSVTEAIFRAVDQGDFTAALKAADYYGPAPKPRGRWARVLHFYLAWEAAEQWLPDAARQAAAEAADLAPQHWTHALYEELSDALAVRAARRLAGAGQDLMTCLEDFVPGREVATLLSSHPEPTSHSGDQQQVLEVQLNERLGRLERLAGEGSAEFVSSVLFLDPETVAAETASLRSLLVSLASYPGGQSGIDRAMAANLTNPYPRYRDIALVPIAIASVRVPDAGWARQRLRAILRSGLDAEGITFTFDLPAILLKEAERRSLVAPQLSDYLRQALHQDDRWGTQIRARSALAAALFWQGQAEAAFSVLQQASQVPKTYAGYASMALLLLADRCHELGVPERASQPLWGLNLDVSLFKGAASLAEKVYDPEFREERRQLVRAYKDWITNPPPNIDVVRATLASIQDPDTRRVYKDLAGACWAAASSPDQEALKALVLMMLVDSTTLDAALGRLFGLRIREHRLGKRVFSDAELVEALAVCAEHFTTGRPWESGPWH
jgi:hypothetical protein